MSAVVTQADELLPCPFCGVGLEGPSTSGCVGAWFHPGVVTDDDCILSGRGFYPTDFTAWNTRHRSEAVEELVKALEGLLSLVDRMDVASWLVTEHPVEWANAGDLVGIARDALAKHRGAA